MTSVSMEAMPMQPKFIVHTLGRFDVIKNGHSLVRSSSGSRKIWELYKFMLTHRERAFTPESLMSQLWVAEEYSDLRSTLRRQMHRMRQALVEDDSPDNERTLIFSNGYYQWNDQLYLQLDTDLFEHYIKQGDSLKSSSPKEALSAYQSALSVYMGDYLPECADQHWIFPIRNHFRRLFLKTVLSTIALLKSCSSYDDILPLCQKAIQIDIYEEAFHLGLMDALLFRGEYRQALEHYEYITSFYYRELGVKPSSEMRAVYKKLLKANTEIQSKEHLNEALDSDTALENAFYCEPEVFKSIFELERRRIQRSGAKFSIGVLAVSSSPGSRHSEEDPMIPLKQRLMERLRKGDTFTRWNDRQYVVLLAEVDAPLAERVLDRVLDLEIENPLVAVTQITCITATTDKAHVKKELPF